MRQWTGSALVQVIACRLFGTKPLPEPMLAYCQLYSWEQISMKFESEFCNLHWRKCIWNYRLLKWRPFCPGGDELMSRTACLQYMRYTESSVVYDWTNGIQIMITWVATIVIINVCVSNDEDDNYHNNLHHYDRIISTVIMMVYDRGIYSCFVLVIMIKYRHTGTKCINPSEIPDISDDDNTCNLTGYQSVG